MAQRVDRSPEDARDAREAAVGLHVAWFVALARTFPVGDGQVLRRDPDIRTAQVDLIQALLLACTDGTSLEALSTRFIDPVGRDCRLSAEATALLTDTVRLVERHLACRG